MSRQCKRTLTNISIQNTTVFNSRQLQFKLNEFIIITVSGDSQSTVFGEGMSVFKEITPHFRISDGRSPSELVAIESLFPVAVPRVYRKAALCAQRQRPVQVESHELVLVLGARGVVVEAVAGEVLVAGDVRRRGHRVRCRIAREMSDGLEMRALLELVADRRRRRKVVEAGEFLRRVRVSVNNAVVSLGCT